ncbi:hypothetical protein PR048_012718 [Dryococelus australis]|uniref:DDE-1 domain-containing protein n=1 Tax=Dryococelus australis TaxID=614101 RepID=A0ABQ9HQJ8_9NEOP|nr:hypothetical protein PR048_012718 [Dryococelus australis]
MIDSIHFWKGTQNLVSDSLARAQNIFLQFLLGIMNENDLRSKPQYIFNVDETVNSADYQPCYVVTTKGSKVVHKVTSGEKGETISFIACCSAVGQFLPQTLILKGTNNNQDHLECLSSGSKICMNPKSAYANAELLLNWFK